jgi:hypothetical protein
VTRVVAQIFRDRETADQGRLKTWYSGVKLGRANMQSWFGNRVAGAEIIDE